MISIRPLKMGKANKRKGNRRIFKHRHKYFLVIKSQSKGRGHSQCKTEAMKNVGKLAVAVMRCASRELEVGH